MIRYILILSILLSSDLSAQKPCSDVNFRQFDFWLGEWEAFALNGKKAGDSRISLILDSCVVLEEWTSASVVKGLRYSGKSFNTWNNRTQQWQQTWVDNTGNSTEYLEGRFEEGKLIFQTLPFNFSSDSTAIRRLTFFDLGKDHVRQLGQISKDRGRTWAVEYDLDYRRRKGE